MRVLSLCASLLAAAGLALGQEAARFGVLSKPYYDQPIAINETFTITFNGTLAREPIMYLDYYVQGTNLPPYLIRRGTHLFINNGTIDSFNATLPVIDRLDPTGNIGYSASVNYTISVWTTHLTDDGGPTLSSVTYPLNVTFSK